MKYYFFIKSFFYSILFSFTIAFPQINFYLTDNFNYNNENDIVFEHDCIHVPASIPSESGYYEMIILCLTEFQSKLNIYENNFNQKLTFYDLYKQNITSEQLYKWSASIDLIEKYENYLISNQSLLNEIFYNCTLSKFGSQCQYSFIDILNNENLSLKEIIYNFYQIKYNPTTLTCYIHLNCNRGSKSLCLDWSEICDGYVDCINDQIDEKYCGEFHINECNDDEYRCHNGQCISKKFHYDDRNTNECLDRTDEWYIQKTSKSPYNQPIINTEDIVCNLRMDYVSAKSTSSCLPQRNSLVEKIMLFDAPRNLSDMCWIAFKCLIEAEFSSDPKCKELRDEELLVSIINQNCPEIIIGPAIPIAFGHIYIGYLKKIDLSQIIYPEYMCYNEEFCEGFLSTTKIIKFYNQTCRHVEDIPIAFREYPFGSIVYRNLRLIYEFMSQCNTIIYDDLTICNNSLMYRCINSKKCISKYRLCDGINDCNYHDDEKCPLINNTCFPIESNTLFKCLSKNKCISINLIGDLKCNCGYSEYGLCEDENDCNSNNLDLCTGVSFKGYIEKYISFPTICDGFTELKSILINGEIHTDETECQFWKCNNIYTHCNRYWNCFNGADEINCNYPFSLIKCPLNNHICLQPITYELMCLPIEKVKDGNIDCLGAYDEPNTCRSDTNIAVKNNFDYDTYDDQHCNNLFYISNSHCINGNEELFCNLTQEEELSTKCIDIYNSNTSDIINLFCLRRHSLEKEKFLYFSIDQIIEEPKIINKQLSIIENQITYNQECHRGFPLKLWLLNSTKIICFCPSSYYGSKCQYQNQRVSLTLQFQAYSDSRRILFSIIIYLIDNTNERIIHSYKQLTYIYIEHCSIKFNFYLIYSKRPKDLTKNYSIHIDIYEKQTFSYRGSFLFPLNYSFLPVHRLAFLLTIPKNNKSIENCQDEKCYHGRCIKYSSNNHSFCQCKQGWIGKSCSIPYKCQCSLDSLCLGIGINNRSICICPLNKWGPRCLIQNKICQLNSNLTCLNNGQCIPIDDTMISKTKFLCICSKGFSGEQCEIEDAKIIVSFHKDIILPEVMLIHFIEVQNNRPILNGSTFQIIPPYQKYITIQWPRPFHIVFTELSDKNYYLIHIQKKYNRSNIIQKFLNLSDRCGHINEYLNETIVKFHLIRRIKYYHLPCQNLISCFYDQNYFCLCNQFENQRLANCFEFNSSFSHNCFGQSSCENEAQCIQDNVNCPKTSKCICQKCYHGTLCQFSSNLFDLTLDGILGYHIQPNINLKNQSLIIKISFGLISFIVIIGLINGFLSIIVFKNKATLQVGCGYYLLGSTVTTLLTSIILGLKFSILLLSQMLIIKNRLFLTIQCYSLDFLLLFYLNMDKWLNACVAIERTINIIKGINFNKKQSKKIAKYIIWFLIFSTLSTTIYDPIYRRLVDDDNDNEKRIWCIISYSKSLEKFNKFIHIFHFIIPFLINILSSIIIILMSTKRRKTIQKDQSYKNLLIEQIQQHRHLLISPIILVILSLPRLILSFISNCMKSNKNPWLSLIGYLISFIPPMLTFIIFVLPSKLYKEQFQKTIKNYGRIMQNRIRFK